MDIDGAEKESVIFYQLLTNYMGEDFAGLQSSRWVKIANPGKLVLASLAPGKYQLCRRPGRILEQYLFELKPGEKKTIDYVRKTGARVRGKVTWPAETKLASIVVSVTGETSQKSPFAPYEWKTVYASLSPGEDGTFLTERIPPGTYLLQAYAFRPLTEEQTYRTGPTPPSFQAQVRIEVPAEGELAAPVLALEPIGGNPPEPAEDRPAAAADKTEKPKEAAAEKPAARTVTVRGKVVDDATGAPIKEFKVQAGKFDLADPKKVLWGWREDPPTGTDGSFSTTVQWAEGWTARIVADGCFPQPVLAAAPPADKDALEVTIRLQRVPEKVRGVVLDHAGQPLQDAAVFTVGVRGLNVSAGEAWSQSPDYKGHYGKDKEAQPVRTDDQGRFELPTGGATLMAVSHVRFDAWPVPVPARGDITIRLPKPARVEVQLDIDGAGKECMIFYQIIPQAMPEFHSLQTSRWITMANPGKLVLDALPPGTYQLCRRAERMLDRELFEVKSGETKVIDYVRGKGARVRGKVISPPDARLTSIVVVVMSQSGETVYASVSPAGDGTFLTERVPPGSQHLEAYAFEEQTPERLKNTSPIISTFQAQFTIEVPDEGELTVKDLVLKRIRPRG